MELEQSFIALIEQSIKANWYLNALTEAQFENLGELVKNTIFVA